MTPHNWFNYLRCHGWTGHSPFAPGLAMRTSGPRPHLPLPATSHPIMKLTTHGRVLRNGVMVGPRRIWPASTWPGGPVWCQRWPGRSGRGAIGCDRPGAGRVDDGGRRARSGRESFGRRAWADAFAQFGRRPGVPLEGLAAQQPQHRLGLLPSRPAWLRPIVLALLVMVVRRHEGHLHPCLSGVEPQTGSDGPVCAVRGRLPAGGVGAVVGPTGRAHGRIRRRDPIALRGSHTMSP
jgi:hypothetical protein